MRAKALIGFALLLALLPQLPVPEFWITQLNYIGLYTLVVIGLVLLTGIAGLTSFGQAAFVGLGAYTAAYLTLVHGVSPWLTVWAGLAITFAAALLLGWVTLRMSGHFLPLATIAWGLSLYYTLGNIDALGKYDGLIGVPAITLFGVPLNTGRSFYYLLWVIVLAAAVAAGNLLDSRTGRAMRAVKGGSTMAEAMGVDSFRIKVTAFVLAALLASISGWLFAHFQRTVNPSPFGLKMGIEYLFMAVIGGVGHVWGALLGAGVVKILEDQLQSILPKLLGGSGNYEIIVFGILLVLALQYARDGIWAFIEARLPKAARKIDWADATPLPARPRPPAGEVVLAVRGARKEFGGLVAVNDVGFEVRAGEILGLIGPNGAGKSTLFNLVTGVLPATRGEVVLRGERIDGKPSRLIARRGVSRTFQHVKMIPGMTVLENVALGAHLRGSAGVASAMLRLDRGDERRLLREAQTQLERIGMGAQMHELAGNLSLGAQRLMEIARALCADPVLLLLDEPAAGLRLKEKQALADVLRQLRGEGMAILLVEHDMDLVMGLVDRLVVMEFGTKLTEGTPEVVQADPKVLAAYLDAALRRTTMASTLLEVTDLHAGYGRAEVLHGLNLRAAEGSVVTVIGPNGAGKSTLLNALMGVLPSRGGIAYQGAAIGDRTLEERVFGGMSLVPETRALFATMSVEDNLRLGAYRLVRAGQDDTAASLDDVFKLFPRLLERRTQQAGTLSGGERQMLAVGRALMGKPRLLMLDEPSLGLAPLVVRDIFRAIAGLRETGVTILLVEQNARAALDVADHGYVLEMGEIALEGPAAELAQDPRVIDTYLGAARRAG